MRKIIGTINFDKGLVDITDPTYDRDLWCNQRNVKIVAGKYRVVVETETIEIFGKRISKLWIQEIRKRHRTKWELLFDKIGVDSGMCGFYESNNTKLVDTEKLYSAMENIKYPKVLFDKDGSLCGLKGITVSSGIGDGCYKVYAQKNANGEIVGLELDFDILDYSARFIESLIKGGIVNE